ncbi:MAG: fumarate lyase [Spirochaetales bacterium]|nr:fumarate lyase [Spirochaetales bacterium]
MTENAPLWGEETAKALENFGGGEALPRSLIQAYGEVKWAALEALQETHQLFTPTMMEALRESCAEVVRGRLDSSFPLPITQGGAGTSFHMNLNEVLSARAAQLSGEAPPDPIEDLARFQSTNDTFATACVVAAYRCVEQAEQSTIALQEILVNLETRHDHVLMVGRTELQDALPMRAGSLFGAWAGGVERDRWRLSKVAERLREVPLGGTALGTGFGAPRRYAHAAERHLRRITSLPLCRSQNMMDGVALKDSLAEAAGALRLMALNVSKFAGDLLYYTSQSIGEIHHPELQYGSSMMPLKANPVLLERGRGLALSAMAEAQKVDMYARDGQLQLNAYLPFLIRSYLHCSQESITAQQDLIRFLTVMELDEKQMEERLCQSPALLNALLPLLGYRALKTLGERVRQERPHTVEDFAALVVDECDLSPHDVARALRPAALTGPPKETL